MNQYDPNQLPPHLRDDHVISNSPLNPNHPSSAAYQPKKPHTVRTVFIVLGIVAFVFLGVAVACTAFVGSALDEASKPSSVASTYPAVAPTSTGPTVAESTPAPKARTLGVKDLVPALKVTSKQCFGSAGCNVEYRVSFTVKGPLPSEDESYDVTYEVRGGEDGPVIGTTTFEGVSYDQQSDMVQTKSSKSKLSVVVTSVEKLS